MDVPLEPLTAAQEDCVLDDIGYSRKRLSEDLAIIRNWVSEQTHLPSSAKSEPDAFFCNFLVGCKGDVKKSKGKIDNYYKFRSRAKDICSKRDPLDPAFAATWPFFQLLTLRKPTPDGSRVLMTLSGIPDFPGYDPSLIVKRILVILEMRLRFEQFQGGEYIVMDNKNYSLSYFLASRPTFMRNVVHFIQNVMPWRIKGVISLNTPTFMHVAINRIIKPMLKTKIARRWHVYTEGSEVLTNHFPSEILPKDQGGCDYSLQEISDRWMEYASSTHWREWLMKEGSETVEEDERQGLLPFKGFWG
ncbi:hypothetical protein GE061_005910 [Apolygus lucorum]|uniref:Uncharacterized protein n=1 Tax=Apolygus lucorum TaxID=248454 RepID=A0A6A4J2Y1_APOLU|nr:hypothetical protein GE061_005910 [Apolygus lucorum]